MFWDIGFVSRLWNDIRYHTDLILNQISTCMNEYTMNWSIPLQIVLVQISGNDLDGFEKGVYAAK